MHQLWRRYNKWLVKPYAVTLPLRRSLTNHSNTYLDKFRINRKVPQVTMDGKALAETLEAASAMGLAAFNLEAVPQETAMDGQEAAALEAFQAAASDLEAVPQAVQEEDQEESQEAVPLEDSQVEDQETVQEGLEAHHLPLHHHSAVRPVRLMTRPGTQA